MITLQSLWRACLLSIRTQGRELFYLVFGAALLSLILGKVLYGLLPQIDLVAAQKFELPKIRLGALLAQAAIAPGLKAALLCLLQRDLCRQPINAMTAFKQGLVLYLPLSLLDLLFNLALFSGLLLAIVPGLIIAVRWSLASIILVQERQSIYKSLATSWRYTARCWPLLVAGYWPMISLQLLVFAGLSSLAPSLPADLWSWQLVSQTLINMSQAPPLIYRFHLTVQHINSAAN